MAMKLEYSTRKSSEIWVEATNTVSARTAAVMFLAEDFGDHLRLKAWMHVRTHRVDPYMLMTPASTAPKKNISITKTNSGAGMMLDRLASEASAPRPATMNAPTTIAPMPPRTVPK